jgi:hypothetical protein
MDLLSAEKEKVVRLYEWAKQALARELDTDFRTVEKAQNGETVATLALLREMPDDQRGAMCTSMLRRAHPAARKLLGEEMDAAEESLVLEFGREALFGRARATGDDYEAAKARQSDKLTWGVHMGDMTTAKLKPIARKALDKYMQQKGDPPRESVWCYRRRFGDWNITTEVDIRRDIAVRVDYRHMIRRADHGPGALGPGVQEPDLGSWNLLGLMGFQSESWTVYTKEQAEEAVRRICEMWDVFFAEIPPLLSDLTIDQPALHDNLGGRH